MSLFRPGNRVGLKDIFTKEIIKKGIINYLRNDKWERDNSHNQGAYYYSVNWDDGTFETYQSERNLVPID